jgi:hypothetical protein
MPRTTLRSVAAAAILAMAAGACPADAAKKHNKAAASGQTPSQSGAGKNHAWGSYKLVFPTVKGTAARYARPAARLRRK